MWGAAVVTGLFLISLVRYALQCRARRQWKRDLLGRWIDSIQVGATDLVIGVPVYRTLGFGRTRWIIDPLGEELRDECRSLDEAIDAVLRRQGR